ncbi:uncharacterized protein LOC115293709 [Suricata suricatta]|uniref:uncharacterized protein LOC115293709 n=1 Tax=Suricata suricatta TaxID=37032 RepID=UPI001155AFD0|nr:uncharacterized protein LOC115293709 [Suricata suricatta]
MAGRSSQKSCEPEPNISASQSFLEEAGPEPLSQPPQASPSLSSLDLSHGSPVALEYLPFFRTYGDLVVEELAPQPEVCRHQEDRNVREAPFPEDSEPPSGFFPFYRSKEECFPRLALPGSSCGVSRDPSTGKEALAGCLCRVTVRSRDSATSASPDLLLGSSGSPPCSPILLVPVGHCPTTLPSRGHALGASGFMPYYRTLEEELHTSPGPATSPLVPTWTLPRPSAATLEGVPAGSSRSQRRVGTSTCSLARAPASRGDPAALGAPSALLAGKTA